jgi:hypothetical protein
VSVFDLEDDVKNVWMSLHIWQGKDVGVCVAYVHQEQHMFTCQMDNIEVMPTICPPAQCFKGT